MLKYMQTVAGYRILARNLGRDGYSPLQVADLMTQRLALDRFDPETLSDCDRQKYEELREFLQRLVDN
jgi:hypothetical protein